MTTAHRPTWTPAQGGTGKYDSSLGAMSKQYSVRDVVAHTKLKVREEGQGTRFENSLKDFRSELEDREREHHEKQLKEQQKIEGLAAITEGRTGLPAEKRPRITHIEANALDADDDDDDADDADSDSDESDSDDDDDTELLLAELEKIKRERADEQARKDTERIAADEEQRRESALQGNPLLRGQASDFTVKRRWDDDVVFKNCAKVEERGKKETFVNDTLRSEYHRKFMDKFIK
ncbi:uncharacterized protein MONBRDRAFT_31430 [Monosiga brevicollis MX1]|uniref:Cwf15/Cwc15 cell cycle control protein n=1 Tax=Monosiga brevicollis TaxID=81824 RepID=A9UT39_MONBE|nr:uncharacterized protein MONBRDRAFT_31430 [Monosiga brevicollis MX1]EDQ91177.1 predicted protein [Monosiga brevicollis MX1]|eukprot:XP_001743599.1 hypothetical protein [Monosiga brevicollis MX1]